MAQIRGRDSSPTSTVDPEILRRLHRIHRQLGDLRDRLARGPKQVKAREANVAKLQADLDKIKAEQKAARMAVDQKQLQLRSGESKINDLQAKLNAANSNREYQALKDQIAADEMANSVLSDEILEALEKLDEFAAAVKEADQTVAKGKEELAKAQQTVSEQESMLAGDVQRLEGELTQAEAELPAELREVYLRLVKTRASDAMAVVEGSNCGGCYQLIPANQYSLLLMSRVVFCHSCGRMLYLGEDAAPGAKSGA